MFWKAAQTPQFLEDMKKAGVDVNVMKGEDLLKNWADTEVRVRELLVKLKLVEK